MLLKVDNARKALEKLSGVSTNSKSTNNQNYRKRSLFNKENSVSNVAAASKIEVHNSGAKS